MLLSGLVGILLAGSPAVPRTLWANLGTVGLPYLLPPRLLLGLPADGRGPGVICMRRTGDSGRREDIDLLPKGLVTRPGPTDWLNFGIEGAGGV